MAELSHWLSTLRAEVSLRLRKTRFRWLASLSGWDCLPAESLRAVLTFAAPTPGLRMAREVTRLTFAEGNVGQAEPPYVGCHFHEPFDLRGPAASRDSSTRFSIVNRNSKIVNRYTPSPNRFAMRAAS